VKKFLIALAEVYLESNGVIEKIEDEPKKNKKEVKLNVMGEFVKYL
jgi:hypothetical protein